MRFRMEKWEPAVDKRVLVLLSGITWSGVGIVLCISAFRWLSQMESNQGILLTCLGLFSSLLIHRFGLLRLVNKNISRILPMKRKVCIFAFQAWKSYLIIALMIVLGTALRHSDIPKHYLAIIYIAMGSALILSSIRYFRFFVTLVTKGE
ncbi:MAG: hypothetical protein HZC12_03715 [Nitrospirae bacterium]|nr:hypothetical protein [Nitrospirota bacterium]